MIVQTLRGQHLSELALLAGALLDLGSFVLEPDLDLVFIQTELLGQIFSPLLGEVAICLEFLLQSAQLF